MNTNHHTLTYDESFEGFLTCIFYLFERKLERVDVVKKSLFHQNMFSTHLEVLTDRVQAERVCRGLKKRLPKNEYKRLYAAFLSEQTEVERLLVAYIRRLFTSKRSFAGDYADDTVLQLTQLARKVGREAHRMEAFVRFKLTKDGLYYANIEPDFDVLPLVGQHFKDRYADQRWLIYDLKRKYGIYYDLQSLEPVTLTFSNASSQSDVWFDESEQAFQTLWKDYFDSTNIKARKNRRLHLQHVPKRYWRYLSEKGGGM